MVSSVSSDAVKVTLGGRKLIAVVHADMVGYSRLIGLDDAGTLRRLRTLRRALIDPAIREHGGSIANTAGDSLLIVFDSIESAARCCVKIQQEVPVYDGDQPSNRAIRFRVGINIGDVISDGTDLHGDGVNVAARLQAECPVGGICVSRAVRDHVHGRLNLKFEKLGSLTLKNIAYPVDAFILRLNSGEQESSRVAHEKCTSDTGSVTSQVSNSIRTTVIKAVVTPAGLFVLVVLLVEVIIATFAVLTESAEKLELLRIIAASVAMLTGAVALLARAIPKTIGNIQPSSLRRSTLHESSHWKVFEKSNDFLATGDMYQFPSLLANTKNEAWFVGTTFYISVGQYRDLFLSKLKKGVDLNFLILRPDGEAIGPMARLLGVTAKELALDCMSGIRVLDRTMEDARSSKFEGSLRVKLIDKPFQTRLYQFDPKEGDAYTYMIPQLSGTNSQNVPGFLFQNSIAHYPATYSAAVLAMWNDPETVTLEAWKSAHQNWQ